MARPCSSSGTPDVTVTPYEMIAPRSACVVLAELRGTMGEEFTALWERRDVRPAGRRGSMYPVAG